MSNGASAWSSAILLLAYAMPSCNAAAYPERPIRWVTGEIGGTADVIARIIGPVMTASLGQQIVIDNRGGANGGLAAMTVARAPRDGHTVLLYASALWIAPLMGEASWDPIKDFSPVSLVASAPNILLVHPSLPAHSVKELIALAKAQPGALNYASGGLGSSPHLAGELFKSMADVRIVRIPYKGTGPAVNALVGGQVQMMFGSAGAVSAHVKTGRLRALAVSSLQPSALAPGLPTIAESGVPGFVTLGLYPLFSPAGTPATIVQRLQREIVQALSQPQTRERLLGAGVEAVGGTPTELAALLRAEMAQWGKLFKQSGISTQTGAAGHRVEAKP